MYSLQLLVRQPRALVIPISNKPPSYSDSVAARSLSGSAYNSDTLTESACASYCGSKGFKYAGVEYSVECCKSQSHWRILTTHAKPLGLRTLFSARDNAV